jgi:hypothetical protein
VSDMVVALLLIAAFAATIGFLRMLNAGRADRGHSQPRRLNIR